MARAQANTLLRLLLLLSGYAFLASSAQSSINPYEPGPYDVYNTTILRLEGFQLDHNLRVHTPNNTGVFSVVYFLSGLGAIIPGQAYDEVLFRLASHGFVVLTPQRVESHEEAVNATWIDDIDDWAKNHLMEKLINEGVTDSMIVDFDTEYLTCHSAGCHILVNYLKAGCGRTQAAVLLSPVDGADPFGIIEDFCIEPGELLNYDTPALIIANGLDDVSPHPENPIYPPCAPAELANKRFYDAMAGPTWAINATEYGHGDMLDPVALESLISLQFCASKEGLDIYDDTYRIYLAAMFTSFFKGIEDGDPSLFDYIEDPNTASVAVTMSHKNGEAEDVCGNPYCSWTPEEP